MKIKFFPEGHVYTVDGRVVPSVTVILRDWWDCMVQTDAFVPEDRYLERGRLVHEAVAARLSGMPDRFEDIGGYVEAAEAAIRVLGLSLDRADIEESIYDERLDVAGTPDLVCFFKGKKCVVDWKTNAFSPIGRWQVGAYSLMAKAQKGVEIVVRQGGSFSTKWHDVSAAGREFVHIANAWRIAQREKTQ